MLLRLIIITIITIGGFIAEPPAYSVEKASYSIDMEPNLVTIDAGYNGAQVQVKGAIPEQMDLIIQIKGDSHDTDLLKKGHVLKLLWMNTRTITFKGLPQTYMLYLPETITLSDLEKTPELQKLKAGFVSLEQETTVTPADEDKAFLFQELFKLKTEEGVYTQQENAITYQRLDGGMKSFACKLAIPSRMKPGRYSVEIALLNNKTLDHVERRELEIREIGFPALISTLAFQHGPIFGILATLIAIVAGFLMGVLFRGGKGGH